MNVELWSLSTDFEIGRTSTPQVGTRQQQDFFISLLQGGQEKVEETYKCDQY